MAPPTDNKYIVFKRDEFEQWQETTRFVLPCESVEDAVVIRRQDFLAPAMMELYHVLITLIRTVLVEYGHYDDSKHLEPQEAYFFEQAQAAHAEARKLPD